MNRVLGNIWVRLVVGCGRREGMLLYSYNDPIHFFSWGLLAGGEYGSSWNMGEFKGMQIGVSGVLH